MSSLPQSLAPSIPEFRISCLRINPSEELMYFLGFKPDEVGLIVQFRLYALHNGGLPNDLTFLRRLAQRIAFTPYKFDKVWFSGRQEMLQLSKAEGCTSFGMLKFPMVYSALGNMALAHKSVGQKERKPKKQQARTTPYDPFDGNQ